MRNRAGAKAAATGLTTHVPIPIDQRVKVFRLQVENCTDFDHYTRLYRRSGRNQFDHNIYFNADTEEKLFDVMRTTKIPRELCSVGEVIGWLMERGIESL